MRYALLYAAHLIHGILHKLGTLLSGSSHLFRILSHSIGFLGHYIYINKCSINIFLCPFDTTELPFHTTSYISYRLGHMGSGLSGLLGTCRKLLRT